MKTGGAALAGGAMLGAGAQPTAAASQTTVYPAHPTTASPAPAPHATAPHATADLDQLGDVDLLDLKLFVNEWLYYCPYDWPLR